VSNELGDRMKRLEASSKMLLPRRTHTVIRVDGKAFHTYTEGLKEPFDDKFVEAMNHTAIELCKQIQGAELAYVQSDEISILLMDLKTAATSAWYDGNVQKQVSVSASIATDEFNRKCIEQKLKGYMGNLPDLIVQRSKRAQFDSRVWTIADPVEVINYFRWRQSDCIRNSFSSIARSLFPHEQLEGKSSKVRREMVEAAGQKIEDYPTGCLRGRVIQKAVVTVPAKTEGTKDSKKFSKEAERIIWKAVDAPRFLDNSEIIFKAMEDASAVRNREGGTIWKANNLYEQPEKM